MHCMCHLSFNMHCTCTFLSTCTVPYFLMEYHHVMRLEQDYTGSYQHEDHHRLLSIRPILVAKRHLSHHILLGYLLIRLQLHFKCSVGYLLIHICLKLLLKRSARYLSIHICLQLHVRCSVGYLLICICLKTHLKCSVGYLLIRICLQLHLKCSVGYLLICFCLQTHAKRSSWVLVDLYLTTDSHKMYVKSLVDGCVITISD